MLSPSHLAPLAEQISQHTKVSWERVGLRSIRFVGTRTQVDLYFQSYPVVGFRVDGQEREALLPDDLDELERIIGWADSDDETPMTTREFLDEELPSCRDVREFAAWLENAVVEGRQLPGAVVEADVVARTVDLARAADGCQLVMTPWADVVQIDALPIDAEETIWLPKDHVRGFLQAWLTGAINVYRRDEHTLCLADQKRILLEGPALSLEECSVDDCPWIYDDERWARGRQKWFRR